MRIEIDTQNKSLIIYEGTLQEVVDFLKGEDLSKWQIKSYTLTITKETFTEPFIVPYTPYIPSVIPPYLVTC